MAKIDELLQELCPDGVEWKTLGEVAEIGTGSSNTKDGLSQGLYPFYTRGQDILWKNEYEFDEEAVITAGDGVGVGKTIHYVKGQYALHQRAYRFSPKEALLCKFLFYYMQVSFYQYICGKSVSSSVSSLRKPKLMAYPIPLPSINLQQKIVEVLDTFTDAISNLEEELALREKQFEYYREQLLSCHDKSNRKMMCELFDMKAGKFISASQISSVKTDFFQYPCYGGNGLRGYVAKNNKDGEYVLVGRQGALCGNVCYVNESFYATEHAVVVADKGCCIPRYTFHLLTFADLNQYKTSGAQPGLSVSRLEKIELYVPSLERQQEIVEILDTFEAMIANIKEEIALRTKQYEYYREKLLSFGK